MPTLSTRIKCYSIKLHEIFFSSHPAANIREAWAIISNAHLFSSQLKAMLWKLLIWVCATQMMFFSSIGVRGGVVHLCLVFFTFCNSTYLVKFVLLFVHVAFTFCSRTISCSFACAVQWWAVVKRHRIAVGQQVAGDSAPEISLAYFFTHFI